MKEIYFIDTSFIIALASRKDSNHKKALELSDFIKEKKIKLMISEFIILEMCNSFAKANLKKNAIEIVDSIYQDPNIEIIKLSDKYFQYGLDLFRKAEDKNWSLIDCISIEIIREKGIKNVLTTDKHFFQAGFNILI
jgi:uncharacterized protein